MEKDKKQIIMLWTARGILIVLIIFWMVTIFGFSAENGEQSQSLSDRITIQVVHIMKPDYDLLSVKEQEIYFNQVSFYVRKTGHFGEYGILGFLWICFLMTFKRVRYFFRQGTIPLLLATTVCMIYAMSDEIHQGFVDGRSPKVLDVIIDTAGGFFGALFLLLIWLLFDRRKHESLGKKY